MVIACVGRTMGKELLCSRQLLLGEESIVCWLRVCQDPSMRLECFTTDEESVEQDYERDRLIGLDHEWVSFMGAQGSPKDPVHAYDSWRTMRSWLGDLKSMRIWIMLFWVGEYIYFIYLFIFLLCIAHSICVCVAMIG